MSGAGFVAPAHASMGLPHLGYTTYCASMGLLQRCFLKSCSTRLRGGMVSPPVVIVYWLDIRRHRAAAALSGAAPPPPDAAEAAAPVGATLAALLVQKSHNSLLQPGTELQSPRFPQRML